MKRKTIKAVLNKKFNHYLESIKDKKVRKLVKNGAIVTGGCITSMLLNEEVKDFDIYFKDKETTLAVADYYVDKFKKKHGKLDIKIEDLEDRVRIYIKSVGVAAEDLKVLEDNFEDVYDVISKADDIPMEALETKKAYRPVFLSSNAITLSDKIQLVIRFFGSPEDIHKNYDFIHTTNSWTSWDNKLDLKPSALEAIINKELVYQGSRYPLASVIRTRKFIKRGWQINAGQYLKMMFQISELNLSDINVLEDQLVGVDSAYFARLIDALKTKVERDKEFKITNDYLTSVIDRIF